MSDASNLNPISMDARKFVRYINNGAAAKIKFFEEAVSRLGKTANKQLRLTALDANSLMYEDTEKNRFYLADIKKASHGRVQLENIRPVNVIEEDKASQYKKNVRDLVDSVCESKLTAADKIFNKIESQRFRAKVVPTNGWMTLRDGKARHISVSSRIVQEDHQANIIRLFSEAVRDNVEMDKGRIIRGTLSDSQQKFIIPINEYTRRRLIAHKMRDAAENAYKSQNFQDLVLECAALVCEGKVGDACRISAKFLKEAQEFSLLTNKQLRKLVENTLATRAQFNSELAKDVSTLFYKTNLKVNRGSIVEAWTKMAQKAEHAGLLTNTTVLAESDTFNKDYDRFLGLVFNEEMDIQTARAKAYRTTLRVIASILPDLEDEDGEEVSASLDELNELVERLSGVDVDTDAVLQAEELLAGISDSLVDSIQDLEGFDAMPGEEEPDGEEGDGDLVPLPEVGGDEGEEEEEGLPSDEEGPPAGPPEEEEAPGAVPPQFEGKLTAVEKMNATQLNEELKSWQVNGDTYLAEDGFNKCYDDMERYVKRCIAIGPRASALRENFEEMRSRMVRTGDQVLADLDPDNDPYLESVMAALNGKPLAAKKQPKELSLEDRIDQTYRGLVSEGEQPWEASGGLSDSSGLRMDDLRGEGGVADKSAKTSDGRSAGGEAAGQHAPQRGGGVVKKGTKPSDGRSGEGSNSGSAGGSTRMDDRQGGGGVQKQGVSTTDGRKGTSKSAQASESTIPVSGGDPALAKGGFSSVGLSMGSDHQGKGKGSVQPKSLTQGDGASGQGANGAKSYEAQGGPTAVGLDMSDDQGGEGVESDSTGTDSLKGQGKVKSDGGLKAASKGGDMSDLQGSDGVAESFDFLTPQRIAEMISEMEGLECGCPKAGACGADSDCQCSQKCQCKSKPVSEEAKKGTCSSCKKPNFICNGKCDGGDSDDGDDGDDDKPKDDDDGDKPKDDGDGGNPFEAQYKGPSRKYHKPGYEKSQLSAEGTKKGDALAEEKVAAFVGSPDSVAAAVDRILQDDLGLGDDELGDDLGLGDDELGGDLGGDGGLGDEGPAGPPADDSPLPPPPGLDDESDDDLDGALDDALSSDDEESDEGLAEGADEVGEPTEDE